MKIDTSSPRLPINRLKRPLIQKSLSLPNDNEISEREMSVFSEDFERDILQKGAEKFKEWLDRRELK